MKFVSENEGERAALTNGWVFVYSGGIRGGGSQRRS